MKKVAIFDVDGTLLNSTWMHAQAWKEALSDFGYKFEIAELSVHIGRGAQGLISDLIGSQSYRRIGKELTEKHQINFDRLGEAKPFPMVKELCTELKRRRKIILLASSALSETVEKHIRILSIEQLIDGRVSGSEVSKGKPAPDIFISAMNLVSDGPATPEDSIVVGDSIWDIEAARNAGIDSIGVLTGGASKELLKSAGAAEVYEDVAELYRNLDNSLLK